MPLYRKKPVVIEAYQLPPDGEKMTLELVNWLHSNGIHGVNSQSPDGTVAISTLEGVMTANAGDWMIKGVAGEVYPCKPDIFEETYDHVEN